MNLQSIEKKVWETTSNIVWHPVARASVEADVYFCVDKTLRETVKQCTNTSRRALLPKLYEYNFTK
jgi:hypothetical protein